MNLKKRVEKLEKVTGIDTPLTILCVQYVSPDGPEPLTPEETAALEAYKKQLETKPLEKGQVIKVIYWTREKAQELLAQAARSKPGDRDSLP